MAIKYPKYRGQLKYPHELNTAQLKAVIKHYERVCEWALDDDGRNSEYDRAIVLLQSYVDALQKRGSQGRPKKDGPTKESYSIRLIPGDHKILTQDFGKLQAAIDHIIKEYKKARPE